MVMDTIGLLLCVTLMSAVRARPAAQRALPLAALAPLAAGDLWCIWHELKSIHLRSLNRERAEIAAEAWLRDGAVPSARQARAPRSTARAPGRRFAWTMKPGGGAMAWRCHGDG